jgi:hypothetical protein
LVVAKVKERLAVSKQPVNKTDTVGINLKKLNEEEVKEKYQVTIKNKFSPLKNLQDNGNINRAWHAIRENINISAKESIGHCEAKHHKPGSDEECSKLVDGRKQTKLQCL